MQGSEDAVRMGRGEPAFSAEIVSPELPCGAAWLANCLIELGVPLRDLWGFDTDTEWRQIASDRWEYVASHLPWQQTLPSLKVGREIARSRDSGPRFSHRWPGQCSLRRPVVLIVRDPRDALYSEWRRQLRNVGIASGTTFNEFLNHAFYHHDFTFRGYLVRWLEEWRATLSARKHLILRFEDWKRHAVGSLGQVTQFLGIPGDEARLRVACERSDHSILKAVELRLAADGRLTREFNRRGMAYEHNAVFTPEMYDALGNVFELVDDWLQYSVKEDRNAGENRCRGGQE